MMSNLIVWGLWASSWLMMAKCIDESVSEIGGLVLSNSQTTLSLFPV